MTAKLAGDRAQLPSPRPWAYRPNRYDDWGWIRDADGETVGHAHGPREEKILDEHRRSKTDPFEANAALICLAVNSFDELKEALRDAQEQLDRCLDHISNGYQPRELVDPAREASDRARAALAKAEGR